MKLSDRLMKIAEYIKVGERVADVGTDHGFLPIYLWENKISPKLILIDVNEGPLEKAKENIKKYNESAAKNDGGTFLQADITSNEFQLRLGSGLSILEKSEVDTVVMAGIGGNLIIELLEEDPEKTNSFPEYILQPRNAQVRLKKWLYENNFFMKDETLVREGRYICEIISVSSAGLKGKFRESKDLNETIKEIKSTKDIRDARTSLGSKIEIITELAFEIPELLFKKKDPLLHEFIENKIQTEENIIAGLKKSGNKCGSLQESIMRREELEKLKIKI